MDLDINKIKTDSKLLKYLEELGEKYVDKKALEDYLVWTHIVSQRIAVKSLILAVIGVGLSLLVNELHLIPEHYVIGTDIDIPAFTFVLSIAQLLFVVFLVGSISLYKYFKIFKKLKNTK